MYENSIVKLINTVVTGNSAILDGGISSSDDTTSIELINSEVSGNENNSLENYVDFQINSGNALITEDKPSIEPSVVVEATDESTIEKPVVEEPATEELVVQEPAIEPVVETPVVETPVVETVTKESTIEEPVTEKPVAEEPAIDEPMEETTIEEPITEEPVTEPLVVKPIVEEPLVEDLEPSLELTEVHRFYQFDDGFHFYTADDNENNVIQAQSEAGNLQYEYEGESFAALASNKDSLTGEVIEDAKEVFRFYNTDTGAHLFTMDVNEKNYIVENLDNYTLEGVAYYAFTEAQEEVETIPVYRMLNGQTNTHLLTVDTNEVNYIQENLSHFSLEGDGGVAFYVMEL